jgi:hypothetical protein
VAERNQHQSPSPEERAALEAFHLQALRYLDGLLTADEARLLNEQLASSAEFRDFFAALSVEMGVLNELLLPTATRQDGELPFVSDAHAVAGSKNRPDSNVASERNLRPAARVWQVAIAAMLLVSGMGVWMWYTNGREELHARVSPDKEMNTEIFNTRLESGNTSRFTLPKVGYVVLEGPAEFTMLGPMRARLNSGRIKMRVTETTGHGFVVETPYGEVTDLGTEFGLDVSDKGKVGLVVFEGEVDLRVAQQERKTDTFSRVERLVGGDGVTFDRGGQLDRIMSIVTGKSPTFRSGEEYHNEDSEPLIARISDNLRASDTKRFYEIVRGGFGEDARAFVDRAYQWNGLDESGLPEFLMGADYILPFNDDKGRNLQITLSLARPATVYILFDDRGKPPNWLTNAFEHTGFEVGMDEDAGPTGGLRPDRKLGIGPGTDIDFAFSVWRQDVITPSSIVLGSREGPRGSRSMYGIVVVPLKAGGAGELTRGQQGN